MQVVGSTNVRYWLDVRLCPSLLSTGLTIRKRDLFWVINLALVVSTDELLGLI